MGITSGGGGQGICEWFVVCLDPELLTFKEMEEMLDCEVEKIKLTVESAVASFT